MVTEVILITISTILFIPKGIYGGVLMQGFHSAMIRPSFFPSPYLSPSRILLPPRNLTPQYLPPPYVPPPYLPQPHLYPPPLIVPNDARQRRMENQLRRNNQLALADQLKQQAQFQRDQALQNERAAALLNDTRRASAPGHRERQRDRKEPRNESDSGSDREGRRRKERTEDKASKIKKFENLKERLKAKGPKRCEKIKNVKSSKYFPDPNNMITGYGKEEGKDYKYEMFKCTDPPRYKKPFYKLTTVLGKSIDDKKDSSLKSASRYYKSGTWEEFNWKPDMQKYRRKRKSSDIRK